MPDNEDELIRVKGPASPVVTLRSEVNPTAEPSELNRVTGPALPPVTLQSEVNPTAEPSELNRVTEPGSPEVVSESEPVEPATPEPAAALLRSPISQLRRLVVTADDTQVVITGQVSSYYLKQAASETVRPLLGARRLLNRVEVSPDAA